MPGMLLDHLGVLVLAKPALDERVDLGDLLVEGHHLLRQRVHHRGGQLLAGHGGVLALGGLDGGPGEGCGVADLAVAQPGRQAARRRSGAGRPGSGSRSAGPAAPGWSVQGPFQRGEDLPAAARAAG